ncbi:LacI family DNA-binding transcriptional regulator [Jiangella rhizosphaerae]|uniref:LacI family DNA-binding transcriptional regulator n=1 Tax=Jiangella rhizosphaerae TaxID=2293569 RepID=A0A418KIH8_9ACTN|nr:substrate-binding domain-containing protein [Jiangella rhizosphaerae]RIQ12686.1 LacI family DNA-binding transcriptional regulator [Jiangella rhizosphaerae]
MRGERPTLDTVARAAGVSKATVSKVLNGRGDVAAATRLRVQEAIGSLGYVPSTGRRVHDTTPTITVLFDAFVNLYSAQVLSGVVAAGIEQGVDVVVTHLAGSSALTPGWFRGLAAKGHVGLIVVTTEVRPEQVRACADAGLGLVAVDPVSIDPSTTDRLVSVSATNWSGGLQATEHLLGLGHRRIGFAGGLPASRPAQQRLHGHLAALSSWNVRSDDSLVLQVGFSHEDGRAMASRLLDLADPPTAIVAGCDASALGVMEEARRRGLRLPEDLSIVGFDDTYAAAWTSPQLTTVRQPMREMGRVALRTLLSLAQGQRPETHHFELATTLVERASTAPLG